MYMFLLIGVLGSLLFRSVCDVNAVPFDYKTVECQTYWEVVGESGDLFLLRYYHDSVSDFALCSDQGVHKIMRFSMAEGGDRVSILMAFSPMDGVSEARRKRFGCEIPRVLSLRKGGNVNSHPEDMMVACREDAENPGTYVGVIAFGDDGEVKFYPDGRCVACSPDEFYIQDREVYEAFRSRVHGKNGDSDRKKDLEKKDLEKAIKKEEVALKPDVLPENVENKNFVNAVKNRGGEDLFAKPGEAPDAASVTPEGENRSSLEGMGSRFAVPVADVDPEGESLSVSVGAVGQSAVSFAGRSYGDYRSDKGVVCAGDEGGIPSFYSRGNGSASNSAQSSLVPSDWSDRPDFASSPVVSSALFLQAGGMGNAVMNPSLSMKNREEGLVGISSVIENNGKKFMLVDARKIFVLNDATTGGELGNASADAKELIVPSAGGNARSPEKGFFLSVEPTRVVFGRFYHSYVSLPEGMVAPKRVDLIYTRE